MTYDMHVQMMVVESLWSQDLNNPIISFKFVNMINVIIFFKYYIFKWSALKEEAASTFNQLKGETISTFNQLKGETISTFNQL